LADSRSVSIRINLWRLRKFCFPQVGLRGLIARRSGLGAGCVADMCRPLPAFYSRGRFICPRPKSVWSR
jgi:hypothetical protein